MPYIHSSTLNFNYLMVFIIGGIWAIVSNHVDMKCPPGYELSKWDTINSNPTLKLDINGNRFTSPDDPKKIIIACVKK